MSLVEPSEGWKEIGWLLRGLAAALVFAVGVIGWAVAIGGTSVVTGWWGLKAATGAIYLGIGVQALVAIPTAVVVRGFAAGRTNRQVMHWCLAMLILPGLAAAVRLIHVGIVQVG